MIFILPSWDFSYNDKPQISIIERFSFHIYPDWSLGGFPFRTGVDMKHKLLFADDEKNLRILYQTEFTSEGYDVDVAEDADQVLEKVEDNSFDLIVLDIMMPGMNGIEVMEKILSKNKKQLVILNTAYSVYKDNFMTWAADAYIIKSADLTELKDKVKELLGQVAAS